MLVREVLQYKVHGIKALERASSNPLLLNIFFPISHHSLLTSSWRAPPSPLLLTNFLSRRSLLEGCWLVSIILVMLQCDSVKGTLNPKRPTAPPTASLLWLH